VAGRAGEEIQGAEDTHNPPTTQLTRSRHVEDAEGIGNEQVASDPRDQKRASLPGRSAISAHQILNNLDLGGPTINNAELRKIAYDERVILCDSINHEERFDEIASDSRAKSRAARGMVESYSNSSGYALAGEGDINPESPPALAVDDPSADDAPIRDSRDAPAPRQDRALRRDSPATRPVRHIVGDDALHIAADLAREQLAIESPHKRYQRP
jgi:hypothetical protein